MDVAVDLQGTTDSDAPIALGNAAGSTAVGLDSAVDSDATVDWETAAN